MIEVVQAGIVERCQAKHPEHGLQCEHFADHFGSHQRATSRTECERWPSEDDVHEAKVAAEVDAMSDEEVEATLIDEENGVTREVVRDWSRGVGVFAKAQIAAKKEIERLRGELAFQVEQQQFQQAKARDAERQRNELRAWEKRHLELNKRVCAERDAAQDERGALRAEGERLRAELASAIKSRDEWQREAQRQRDALTASQDCEALKQQLADALANEKQVNADLRESLAVEPDPDSPDFDSACDAIIRRDRLIARLSAMAPLAPDHGGSLKAIAERVDLLTEMLRELARAGGGR